MPELQMSDEQFILERTRIHDLLEKTVQNSVVFVTAGEGYGKTYAVNSFLRKKNRTAIWLSLTERDNDPMHFWENVVKAVSFNHRRIGKSLEEIGLPQSPSQITRCFSITADFIAHNKQYAVVLDNVHIINEESIFDIINGFLASPYLKGTTILISRREPNLNAISLLSKGL
ncbi:MAG: helix-turn-helix transcriptional regulator, partial [Treponema sp.]|nr:helix-turn-helix transcriptional regulator [Treponema sp.]